MNAPALNIASSAHAGAAGHGAAAAAGAAAGGQLAGFEALLAALFPQADPTAGAAVPSAGAPTPTVCPTVTVGPAGDDTTDPTDAQADATATGADAAGADAAAALAASLVATQTDVPSAAPETSPAPETTEGAAPPAWGRDKPQGAPAQPGLLHANPKAGLADKVSTAPEPVPETMAEATADASAAPVAATEAEAPVSPTTDEPPAPPAATAIATDAAAKSEPPAWGRDKVKGAPAAPALANANPRAHLAEKAAPRAVEPPPVQPIPVETPPPVVTAETAAHAEPAPTPAPAPPTKSAKAERGKAVAEVAQSIDPHTADAAAPLEHAKAVTAAAKTASAEVETPKADAHQAKAAPDTPDATPQADARAASQSAAPAVHAAHAVRGAPETVANLAAQIVKKLEGRSTRFDLELDPAGLGKVDVRVEIGAHGRLTAAMTCDNPQAAAELRSRASELQRALEQAGFDLSGGISFDVAGDRGRQQGQAWQDQADNGGGFRGQAFRAALETAGDAADAAVNGALRLRRGVAGGLDLRI